MASLTVGQGRVPVTVLIGYLGSGKTTLLNRILVERSDKKYAVIDIFEMNNGCICCTVRADLSRILNKLLAPGMKELDGVIVETTGLADPAPVAQTFFVDEHLEEQKPDGVENEAVEQVAFADRILLNKCDLLDEGELAAVESKLRSLNKAFDLKKVLDIEPDFLDTDGEHVHDDSITSIGLRQAGALDMVRVNAWLTDLLAKEGVNIFRMKGILNIRGQDMKFVFQGVHMLFSGEPLEPWNAEPRESRIVFIGRDLKKESLERHLASCLA
ncbi:ATP binding protein [Aureococcus anophagefferens]|nr:ATP binding protein [Aureococcus anophagefferens]